MFYPDRSGCLVVPVVLSCGNLLEIRCIKQIRQIDPVVCIVVSVSTAPE